MHKVMLQNLDEDNSTLSYDLELFLELANPNHSYDYEEVESNLWEFKDKYQNTVQVEYFPSVGYVNSHFNVIDKDGVEFKMYDYLNDKSRLTPFTFFHGHDERRSDTIAKIILNEIVPNYLISNSQQLLKMMPITSYRYQIFLMIAKLIKQRYPQVEIQEKGNKQEIWIINK